MTIARDLMLSSISIFALACGKGSPAAEPQEPAAAVDDDGTGGSDAADGIPCSNEIEFVCDDGHVDACLAGLTLIHACVEPDAAEGPPCSEEIALACDEGQIDACSTSPASAETHICIED